MWILPSPFLGWAREEAALSGEWTAGEDTACLALWGAGGREGTMWQPQVKEQKQSQRYLPSGLGLGLDWVTGPTPQ